MLRALALDCSAAAAVEQMCDQIELELQRHFANALDHGLEYLTMEVSSQALKYHRTLCTRFAAACFLNIGLDHISPIEHPDFEDYFSSKLKIFAQGAVNCVNLDCDHADRILAAARAACPAAVAGDDGLTEELEFDKT